MAHSSAMDTWDSDEDTDFDGSRSKGTDMGPTSIPGSLSTGNLCIHHTFTSIENPMISGGMRGNEKKTSKSN